jgi:hypothetical protein
MQTQREKGDPISVLFFQNKEIRLKSIVQRADINLLIFIMYNSNITRVLQVSSYLLCVSHKSVCAEFKSQCHNDAQCLDYCQLRVRMCTKHEQKW